MKQTVDLAQKADDTNAAPGGTANGGQSPSPSQPSQGGEATPAGGTPGTAAPQAQPNSQTPAQASASAKASPQTQHEQAEEQVKAEEKQRVLGVVPLFNVSYNRDSAPMTVGEKFRLAFRSAIDPATFAISALDAGYNMGTNSFPAYGQGAQGYGKYLGASYADTFDGTMIGNALFPAILRQDPRYFRMGEGTITHRLLYSIATTVWCRNDNGKWGPNYSNVLGNLAAGGISNLYYPAADRGASLTIERGLVVTAEGTLGAVFDEFWPDVAPKILKGPLSKLRTGLPPPTAPPARPN